MLGGGIGFAIGQSKDRAAAGFFLGLFFAFVGWIVVAVMEPSDDERQHRANELARAIRGTAGADRPCPYCAELIKSAATICRFCGREVERVQAVDPDVPLTRESIRQRDRYQRLADQYPAVFDQVWALACNERDWTAEPADVLADACHWVEQGQPINKAVHKAFSQGVLLHGTETLLFKRRR